MILLGINGRKRSGKDTFAQYMIDAGSELGIRVVRRGFADKLKISAARAIGLKGPDDQLVRDMDLLKDYGAVYVEDKAFSLQLSGREFLQLYGTEAHRDVFGEDFWVDALLPRSDDWDKHFDGADVGVVTDVRFDNEAERVNAYGMVVVINRPGLPEDSHASEKPLSKDMLAYTIENDASLHDLNAHARKLLGSLLSRRRL